MRGRALALRSACTHAGIGVGDPVAYNSLVPKSHPSLRSHFGPLRLLLGGSLACLVLLETTGTEETRVT